ncbi:unnamed protein product, partial [Mesorhabditis spiculigera]
MFIYLSKKVTTPHDSELQCVSWNQNTDFIAAGGTNGSLRILKLAPAETSNKRHTGADNGIATPTNLSVNKELEAHTGTVLCVCFNEVYQKLTSSDSNGLIVVWSLSNDNWYEDMLNNRNQSRVVSMSWNSDGSRIAIAYQDGMVILGSAEGNRVWHKEMPGQLAACCWSPDGYLILLGFCDGEVHAYDSQGNFMQKLQMTALENVELETALVKDLRKDKIISLCWWAPVAKTKYVDNGGYKHKQTQMFNRPNQNDAAPPRITRQPTTEMLSDRQDGRPRLLIAYEHGVIQLMRNETDTQPVMVRLSQIAIACAAWAPNGGFFAVTGQLSDAPTGERNVVLFYTAHGERIRMLKVQGNAINGCAWDSTGLRCALAIDRHIYFTNIRPNYLWGYCADSVVYTFETAISEFRVIFYDVQQEAHYTKAVRHLENLSCNDEYCIISSRSDEEHGSYLCQLCNGMGTQMDFKYTEVKPEFVELNAEAAVIATEDLFYIWHFNLPKKNSFSFLALQRPSTQQDTIHHLDGSVAGPTLRKKKPTEVICALVVADTYFLAAIESGIVYKFSLTDGSQLHKFPLLTNIEKMYFNCTFTKLVVLTHQAVMRQFDVSEDGLNSIPGAQRTDVWNVKWDHEKDDTLAVMEKTRLFVIRGRETEEPVNSSGYIASFKGLSVRTVMVDQFLQRPEHPERRYIVDIEVKALREAKSMLTRMKVSEATAYIEKNPHPRLWALLAEVALNKGDLATAEHAYVMLKDYQGLQFCKKAQKIDDVHVREAEIYYHLGKIDEAERLFFQADRRDLALEMFKTQQDWFRVLKILQTTTGPGDDQLLKIVYERLGDYFYDRQNWENAIPHYEQSKNLEKLKNCYLRRADYNSLRHLATQLQPGNPLLIELSELFASAGLCEAAVENFLRCDRLNEALDTCIQLNQWEKAVTLSRTHNLKDVDSLLGKYAEALTGSNERTLAAVQLYRRAGKYLQAAKVIYDIAEDERKRGATLLRLKKIYVLGALMVEDYHCQQRIKFADAEKKKDKNADEAQIALSGLLEEDNSVSLEESRMIDSAWRGAEAYHFYMLAQKGLYQGNFDAAMKCAFYLMDFDDLLDPVEVYSVLAITSCATRQFSVASRAFMKLESLSDMAEEEKSAYRTLAIKIFNKYPPSDTVPNLVGCINCEHSIPDYSTICPQCDIRIPMCVVTGRPLFDYQFWLCPICKHRAYEQHISNLKYCPLCHHAIE